MAAIERSDEDGRGTAYEAAVVALLLVAMVGAMLYSVYGICAPGARIGYSDFALLWFRELLILGTAVFIFLLVLALRIRKALKESLERKQRAL